MEIYTEVGGFHQLRGNSHPAQDFPVRVHYVLSVCIAPVCVSFQSADPTHLTYSLVHRLSLFFVSPYFDLHTFLWAYLTHVCVCPFSTCISFVSPFCEQFLFEILILINTVNLSACLPQSPTAVNTTPPGVYSAMIYKSRIRTLLYCTYVYIRELAKFKSKASGKESSQRMCIDLLCVFVQYIRSVRMNTVIS